MADELVDGLTRVLLKSPLICAFLARIILCCLFYQYLLVTKLYNSNSDL